MCKILIQKDRILNQWVVWEIHNNYEIALYKTNEEKKAKGWLKKHELSRKTKKRV